MSAAPGCTSIECLSIEGGPATRRRRPPKLIAGVLMVVILAAAAPAATDPGPSREGADAESELEANRRRQQELASQIDLLQASDVELSAELASLESQIAVQEDELALIDAELVTRRAQLADLRKDLARSEEMVAATRDLAVQRAVGAYVQPPAGRVEVLVGTKDINDLMEKDVLFQSVASNDQEVIGQFEAAAAEAQERKAAVGEAMADLEAAEADAADALGLLEQAKARQEAVREMLAVRVNEFRSEADELVAAEAELQDLIDSRIPPPTTAAPTTTQAPTTASTTSTSTPGTTIDPGGSSTTSSSTTVQSSSTTTASTASTTTPPNPGYNLMWPVSGVVTSPFGPRWGRMHNGIDIAAPTGTPISAAAGGEVFFAGWMTGFGNVVLVDHFNGLITLYAHQDSIKVSDGARVAKGDQLGTVGSTGNSTGPHLHFETRVDGVPYDPMAYLP